MNKTILACSAAAGASLYFVYALSVFQFAQHLDASSVTLVEFVLIGSQVARLAGVVAYYGLRPARIEVLLVLFSFETFVVMGLIVLYLVSPDPVYSQLAHTIFSTWIASIFIVLPSYIGMACVSQMARGRSLLAAVVPAALEFGFLLFVTTAMIGFVGTFSFASFFDFLVSVTKSEISGGAIPGISALSILVPSVTLYCSLLVYSSISSATSSFRPRANLLLPLVSATIALGWATAGGFVVTSSLLSFGVPGVILVAVLWGYMRR